MIKRVLLLIVSGTAGHDKGEENENMTNGTAEQSSHECRGQQLYCESNVLIQTSTNLRLASSFFLFPTVRDLELPCSYLSLSLSFLFFSPEA